MSSVDMLLRGGLHTQVSKELGFLYQMIYPAPVNTRGRRYYFFCNVGGRSCSRLSNKSYTITNNSHHALFHKGQTRKEGKQESVFEISRDITHCLLASRSMLTAPASDFKQRSKYIDRWRQTDCCGCVLIGSTYVYQSYTTTDRVVYSSRI